MIRWVSRQSLREKRRRGDGGLESGWRGGLEGILIGSVYGHYPPFNDLLLVVNRRLKGGLVGCIDRVSGEGVLRVY